MNGLQASCTGTVIIEPEGLRYTKDAVPALGFLVAIDDAQLAAGAQKEVVRVTAWGDEAEELEPQIGKGARVAVAGRLRLTRWTGKDGAERVGLSLSAKSVTVLEQRRSVRRGHAAA